MKNWFLGFLVLILLSGLCFGISHNMINAQQDRVKLTETTLMGDIAQADGLTIQLKNHLKNHLFWDTDLRVGGVPETTFRFSQKKQQQNTDLPYSAIDGYLALNAGISYYHGGDIMEDPLIKSRQQMVTDVGDRTGKGETHRENIHFKDYYNTYPIEFQITLDGRFIGDTQMMWQEGVNDGSMLGVKEALRKLQEQFQFPVLENHSVTVEVIKDDDGRIYSVDFQEQDFSGVSIYTHSVQMEGMFYFIVTALDQESGRPLDYNLVPHGFGLYRIPCEVDEAGKVFLGDLSLIQPLSLKDTVEQMVLSEDKSKLLLILRGSDGYRLKVIDATTGRTLQELFLQETEEEVWMNRFYVGTDFLVASFYASDVSKFMLLEEQAGGQYALVYGGQLPKTVDLIYDNFVMAYDGNRLAIACQLSCGFYLGVYDRQGLRYLGRYENSLDQGVVEENYRERCQAWVPLQMVWE